MQQIAILTKTVETCFPKLYDSLKSVYPSMDRKDWLHCCLYLLQLKEMEICVLLHESYQSCRRRTKKIENKLNVKGNIAGYLLLMIND